MEKKKDLLCKSMFLAIACCLCVMCFSCIKAEAAMKKSAANVLKLYKQGKVKKAQKMADKLPESANEKCVKNMSAKMKKAYYKKVKALSKKISINSYYLTDIDNDNKAELIVQTSAEQKIRVFTYKKGKAVKVGELWSLNTIYNAYPNKNGVIAHYLSRGYNRIYLITMKNMKLKMKLVYEGLGDWYPLPYSLDGHFKSYAYKKNGIGAPVLDYSDLK